MVHGVGFPKAFSTAQMEHTNVWQPDFHSSHNYTSSSWKYPYSEWKTKGVWKKTKLTVFDFVREAIYPFPLVITPLFPLIILSVARQKYSPDTKNYFKKEYDYIVVGSGGGGAVVASRLSEVKCVTVLLLEAGKAAPLISDIPSASGALLGGPIDWHIKTVPQKYTAYGLKNNQVLMPRAKVIGGSTVHNTMLYVRGNRKDYDEWEAQGAKGWGWRDVYPYFLKLENNTDYDIVQNGYHSTHGPMSVGRFPTSSPFKDAPRKVASYLGYPYVDVNGPSQIGFSDFQGNIRDGQRCSNAKAYLVPAEDRPNLDIVADAFVTKVLIAERKAIGVQFDSKGRRYEVRARREVILSAGSINSAKLLMLSGIGPRKTLEQFGIPVIADLPVGKNYHDHQTTVVNFSVRRDITPYFFQLENPLTELNYVISRSGSLGNAQGVFSLAFFPYNYTKDPLARPDFQIYFLEAVSEIAMQRYNLKLGTFLQLYGPYFFRPTLWCLSQGLHPRSRGYVSIRSRNPYDQPIVDPNYLADPEDVKVIVRGMKFCLEIARTPPMQKFLTRPFKIPIPGCEKYFLDEMQYLTCYARQYAISVTHDVGTARMGDPSDPRTVVDPELRVKYVKGLRVVDSSVMPSVTSGNTWTPTVMIAEKASDMIKKTIHCSGKRN